MIERYIRTPDDEEYVDTDCVRDALGISEDDDIFGEIRKLKEELERYKSNCDYFAKLAQDRQDRIASLEKEKETLQNLVRTYRIIENTHYGMCAAEPSKQPAFHCGVVSYSWSFDATKGFPVTNNSIRVELNLTPTANYKGTFDLEDLKRYIQEYGNDKKLGVLESVDYQYAKAARVKLAELYKQIIGVDRLSPDLSPKDISKAILDAFDKIRDDWDAQKEKKYELIEFRDNVCEIFDIPSSNTDELILKELRNDCNRYDELEDFRADICGILDIALSIGTPKQNDAIIKHHIERLKETETYKSKLITEMAKVLDILKDRLGAEDDEEIVKTVEEQQRELRELRQKLLAHRYSRAEDCLAELRAKIREIYRSILNDSWPEGYSCNSALNDINEEYKRVVHNFEERTADWNEVKQQFDRYCLAIGSLLNIPADRREDISWIEDCFRQSRKEYESEHERANGEHKRAEKLQKDYDNLGKAYSAVLKWNNTYAEVRRLLGVSADADAETMIAAVKLLRDKDPMNLQKQNDDLIAGYNELMSYKIKIEKELHKKDLKLSDSERRRKMWMVRYESEHKRANGEHRRAEGYFNDIAALKTQVSHLMSVRDAMVNEEVGLQSLKNAVRKLQNEKNKVIEALGQDIWDDCME